MLNLSDESVHFGRRDCSTSAAEGVQLERYIQARADKVRILSPTYTSTCMLERNRHLVDNSGHLICYLRENHGGTFYTMNYAEKQGLSILRL